MSRGALRVYAHRSRLARVGPDRSLPASERGSSVSAETRTGHLLSLVLLLIASAFNCFIISGPALATLAGVDTALEVSPPRPALRSVPVAVARPLRGREADTCLISSLPPKQLALTVVQPLLVLFFPHSTYGVPFSIDLAFLTVSVLPS